MHAAPSLQQRVPSQDWSHEPGGASPLERTARVRRSMRGALAQKSDPPQEQRRLCELPTRWPAARQPDPDQTSHRALGSFPDRRFSHARALRIACSGPPAPRRLADQRDGCLGMKQAGDRPVKAAHCSKSPVHALACILARLLPLATDLLTEPIEPTLVSRGLTGGGLFSRARATIRETRTYSREAGPGRHRGRVPAGRST